LWLLIGAALMVQTLQNFRAVDVGLDREHVLSIFVNPEPALKAAQVSDLRARVHDRLKALPGVQHVSFSTYGLFAPGMTTAPVRVPDSRVNPANDPDLREGWVSPEFFETMGLHLVLGRTLTEQDARSKVGVINEVVARAYFGDDNPLGKLIYFPKIDSQNRYVPFGPQLDLEQAIEIVGVVADTKESVQEAPIRMVYMPIDGRPEFGNAVYVRTTGNPVLHENEILQALREFNKDVSVTSMTTLDKWIEGLLGEQRLLARLLAVFGTLALILAAVGLFGVMAYAVARRTAEIGVRMALGARRSGVVVMILREAGTLAIAGIALGVPAVIASARLLSKFLFGLKATDPATIVLVSVGLLFVAVVAGYLPARRAAKVDPLVALRHD
jgi:predicted permease